ncbi:MAG: hypothetical protein JSU70_23425 [Phycisphaerales bacterium]|nr:MAG: hypothetical protein JSU70_23425 [Phycisphaerales bacterium]
MQNKANSPDAKMGVTSCGEKCYGDYVALSVRKNKANSKPMQYQRTGNESQGAARLRYAVRHARHGNGRAAISAALLQNKANFANAQVIVRPCGKKCYGDSGPLRLRKRQSQFKAKQSQFQRLHVSPRGYMSNGDQT